MQLLWLLCFLFASQGFGQWEDVNNKIYPDDYANDKVGIGTNNPEAELHVNGEIKLGTVFDPQQGWQNREINAMDGELRLTGPYRRAKIAVSNDLVSIFGGDADGGTAERGIKFFTGSGEDFGLITMHVHDGGVGIGTSFAADYSPIHKLTVRGGTSYFNSLSYGETTQNKMVNCYCHWC